MSNWIQLRSDILDYIDGLLPQEKRKIVDTLLQENAEAQEFFDEMKNLRTGLANLTPIKTSEDFDTVLRTRIRMEKSMHRRPLLTLSVPAAVALGVAVVLAIFLVPKFSSDNGLTLTSNGGSVANALSADEIEQTQPAPVHYPIDLVRLPSGGTAINSESLRERMNRPDSLRTVSTPSRPLRTVEF